MCAFDFGWGFGKAYLMVALPRRSTPGMLVGWILAEAGAADARKHSSNSRNAGGSGENIMMERKY